MLNRCFYCVLGLAASLAFGTVAAGQDAAPAPASLSTNQLMDEELAKPDAIKIDPALLTPPEDADADQLFEFVETLQDKLPRPQSQEDMYKLVDAFSQASLNVANKILALDNLTPEQRERAVQLKVVSLTTRANVDEKAAADLNVFVEDNLKNAKTDEELVKAYQLKLQVLASSQESPAEQLEKIEALADEAFLREQEELQLFAIEVKANAFIKKVETDSTFDKSILDFVDGVIKDEKRSDKVKEKAYEMKLVALIVACEVEKSKEDDADQKALADYEDQKEKLFTLLLDGKFSMELKKNVYQLRVQTLLDSPKPEQEKIDDLIARLFKEEEAELYALGVAVKGQTLLTAARENPDNVKALTEFADQIVEEAKTRPELKTQSIGLKIQSFSLQDDVDGLFAYVEQEIAKNPEDDLKDSLIEVKLRLITNAVVKDPAVLEKQQAFLDETAKDDKYAALVAQVYSARFSSVVSKIAEDSGSIDDFNAALEQFKKDLAVAPRAITALMMAKQAIDVIGESNKKPTLYDDTVEYVMNYCKASDVEALNTLAQSLETYMENLKLSRKQAEEAQKKAAEEKAESADAPKAEEKKAEPAAKIQPKTAPNQK
ncbi:MAG: hypothetical protein IIU43_08115 [Thermoguttaceae bacterium]|nr:hypothetical protein [Thermoguttaceae bacterium]